MRKICFSSVLQEKGVQGFKRGQTSQRTLHEMVEQCVNYPSDDYTLRFSSEGSIHSASSNQGFEEGCNPLDQWMSSQIQNNKQNLSDTQPRRKIPNELLKYVKNNSKSPIRQNETSQPNPKNTDMRQICRDYAQNKKKGQDVQNIAPVWKFSSRQNEQNELDRRDFESEIKQSITAQKFKEQKRLDQRENELLNHEFSRLKKQTISNAVKALPEQSKGKNLSAFIEEIKNNLAKQIQAMAQRIIQQRNNQQEDQQLLISQTKSISNNEQQRFQQARKQIGQYLSMRPDSSEREEVHEQKKSSLKVEAKASIENDKRNEELDVGYSFASDFNSGNQGNTQIHEQPPSQNQNTKKSANLNLPNSQISLPNIDQVKSEHDGLQKRDDFIEDSMAINNRQKNKQGHQSIDKNYIKEIQSVAYTQNHNEYRTSNNIGQYGQTDNEIKVKESPVRNQNKSFLLEQINKTAKSIEDQQQVNEVNISVAQEQHSINHEIIKDEGIKMNTSLKIQNLTQPANAIKIQFKKITSPQRKYQNIPQIGSPINTGARNYFTQNNVYTPTYTETTNYTNTNNYAPQSTTFSYQKNISPYVLQEVDQRKQIQKINNISSIQNSVKMPLGENKTVGNQNSKERSNDVKGSFQDNRKIKLTISPKYQTTEQDKQNYVTIGDFKQTTKTEDGFTRVEYHTIHYPNTLGSPSSNVIRQSIGISRQGKQNKQGRLKLSNMFPNSNTYTDIREVKESIQKDKQNAGIKISKYEKTEVYVEQGKAKQSIRSNVQRSGQFEFDLDF